jgi:uncharacterized Fe-S cluster-containing MiaB family protein
MNKETMKKAVKLNEDLEKIKEAISRLENKKLLYSFKIVAVDRYLSDIEVPSRCQNKLLDVLYKEKDQIEKEIDEL